MAIIGLPLTSAQSPVTFRVEPNVSSEVGLMGEVAVDVYIDAPAGSAIVGWTINIRVDPAVLFIGSASGRTNGSEAGYFLYDWAFSTPHPNWPNGTELVEGVTNWMTGTLNGTFEGLVAWGDITPGEGASGTGKLITYFFSGYPHPDQYSPIEITKAYYYDSYGNKVEPHVVHGHYKDPTYDVAVTSVSAPSQASVGDIVDINVDVTNLGAPPAFSLELTYGTTTIENRLTSLTTGASKTEVFSWDTTGVAPGVYTITAEAILAGDVNTADNVDTTTITIASYRIDMVRHSAWPGTHHTHDEERELFAIIKNVGTETTQGKVVFTIEDSSGPVDIVETVPQSLEPGDMVGDKKDYSTTWTAPISGKYYVTAEAWYYDGISGEWRKSPDNPKTFGFTVVD